MDFDSFVSTRLDDKTVDNFFDQSRSKIMSMVLPALISP